MLDDVISQRPEDSEMAAKFAQSETHSGLMVYLLEPEFAVRVTSAISQVVTGILSGTIRSGIHDQPYGDARTVEQYLEALRELPGAPGFDFESLVFDFSKPYEVEGGRVAQAFDSELLIFRSLTIPRVPGSSRFLRRVGFEDADTTSSTSRVLFSGNQREADRLPQLALAAADSQ